MYNFKNVHMNFSLRGESTVRWRWWKIMQGENTCGRAVVLCHIRFLHVGVCISAGLSYIYMYTWPNIYSHSWGVSVCNLWLVMVTTHKTGTWDSSVIIVTRVVARCLKDCSMIPYRVKRFVSSAKHPDQFWGIPGLIFDGYQGFSLE